VTGLTYPEPHEASAYRLIVNRQQFSYGLQGVLCFGRLEMPIVAGNPAKTAATDLNPQTFTDIPKAKLSDFKPATERVYHSFGHSSLLVMG